MPILHGPVFFADGLDCLELESVIAHGIAYRREHGRYIPSARLLELQTQIQRTAATSATVTNRPVTPAATDATRQGTAGPTMDTVTASEVLEVSQTMVKRWCETEVLDAVKSRGKWRISRSSVDAHRTVRSSLSA